MTSEEEDQAQQLPDATGPRNASASDAAVAEATVAVPSPVHRAPAVDPLASTLSMQPEASTAPRPASKVGRDLGTVRLLREIGRGATGSVYLGHHKVLGRDVAVKFLVNVRPESADGAGLKRFLDEARAAAAVRHTHLTQIYHADVDEADGTPYLVLEYVQGPNLKQLLDQAGPFDLAAAVAVATDAASAVHELHVQGIVHRDVKPSNVLLDKDGCVFVTDFGLAMRQSHGAGGAVAGPGGAQSTDFAGTPAYMAPEMFDGRVSPRSDVYALGVMTFQLLTGSVPFSGSFHELREQHLGAPVPSERLRKAGVPAEVVEVLERAVHKQPMFRYKTPLDYCRGLKQAAGCGDAELRRARKTLCDSVAGRRAFAAASPGSAGLSEAGPAHDEDDRPSTTTYPEMLARFATIRRERRVLPAEPRPAPEEAPGLAPLALAVPAEAPAPEAGEAPEQRPVPVVPGPVLGLSVLGILYGTLLAVWVVGETFGTGTTDVPGAVEAARRGLPWGVVAWRVVIMLAALGLSSTLVTASMACFRLRPWARRLMIWYAASDLAFQAIVLLTVFAWVGPVTVNALAGRGAGASPVGRATTETAIYVAWTARWLLLSFFPAVALAVITRPAMRSAFRASTKEA